MVHDNPPMCAEVLEQPVRPAVEIITRHHLIPRTQQPRNHIQRRHPRRHGECPPRRHNLGQVSLEMRAGWISRPCVVVLAAPGARRLLKRSSLIFFPISTFIPPPNQGLDHGISSPDKSAHCSNCTDHSHPYTPTPSPAHTAAAVHVDSTVPATAANYALQCPHLGMPSSPHHCSSHYYCCCCCSQAPVPVVILMPTSLLVILFFFPLFSAPCTPIPLDRAGQIVRMREESA